MPVDGFILKSLNPVISRNPGFSLISPGLPRKSRNGLWSRQTWHSVMLAALPQPPAYAPAALSSVSPSQPLPLARLQPFFGSREVSGAMRTRRPLYTQVSRIPSSRSRKSWFSRRRWPMRRLAINCKSSGAPGQGLSVTQARLMLVGVAALYGALTVVLRLLFLMDGAPTAAAMSAIRGLIAALCFAPAAFGLLDKQAPMTSAHWWGAAEMAFYNLGAQGLLAAGIARTDATRAAFLTQASVILTPVLAKLSGEKVSGSMWVGCILAMVGVTLLGLSDPSSAVSAASTGGFGGLNTGDLLCLGGAAWKTIILSAMYVIWALVGIKVAIAQGLVATSIWPGYKSLAQWGLIAFTAIGPGALGDWMQGVGQRSVSPAESNVILSSEPLWAALLACGLLAEKIQGIGIVGAGLLVSSALVAGGIFENRKED
ncbi:hypothetical protein AAMO2058_000294600 [Amorphochlora amoebiformis]